MPSLYRRESSYALQNAQRNLAGRTHYVDDDTLKWHKARVLGTHITHDGLIFTITESCALDMHNTRRGFRYVVFDIFGNVLSRVNLEDAFKTHAQADKAKYAFLDTLDAEKVTPEAAEKCEKNFAREMQELRNKIKEIKEKKVKGAA